MQNYKLPTNRSNDDFLYSKRSPVSVDEKVENDLRTVIVVICQLFVGNIKLIGMVV